MRDAGALIFGGGRWGGGRRGERGEKGEGRGECMVALSRCVPLWCVVLWYFFICIFVSVHQVSETISRFPARCTYPYRDQNSSITPIHLPPHCASQSPINAQISPSIHASATSTASKARVSPPPFFFSFFFWERIASYRIVYARVSTEGGGEGERGKGLIALTLASE